MKNLLNMLLLAVMIILLILVLYLDINKEQKVITLVLVVVLAFTILEKTDNLKFETFQIGEQSVVSAENLGKAVGAALNQLTSSEQQAEPAGGVTAGGVPAGGVQAGGVPAGGVPAGGVQAGGVPAGGVPAGGVQAGGVTPGVEPAATSQAVTSPAVTSPAATSQAVTSPAATSQAVTSQVVTSQAVTSQAVTSPAVTSPAVTSPTVTSPAVTSPAVTVQTAPTSPAVTGSGSLPPMTSSTQSPDITEEMVEENVEEIETEASLPTVIATMANKEDRVRLQNGLNEINKSIDLMNKEHLEIVSGFMKELLLEDDEEIIKYNIALIKEAFKEIIFNETGVNFNASRELDEAVEYKQLRDSVLFKSQSLELAEIELIHSVFTSLFNINETEKRNILSLILGNINNKVNSINQKERRERLKEEAAQRREIMERNRQIERERERERNSRTQASSHQTPVDMPTEMSQEELIKMQEEAIKKFLNPPSVDNISKYFESQNVKDLVYNVGAPAKNYMTDIIRPNPVSERKCLQDRNFPKEPVEVLASGTPAGAYEFQGVGTMLPKFAYTEVYNDKYY